ncbi:hypothetical protein Pint_07244 [Pistacia integerrima]|uniref:Uncharacterized protein n=1 Tax=Pistacia integerrima TaxID=434235 RepID=A0ACC0XWJ8_9ROSI|nr:hypothetical protein Pint_07244 [Pistacia integerrima]
MQIISICIVTEKKAQQIKSLLLRKLVAQTELALKEAS